MAILVLNQFPERYSDYSEWLKDCKVDVYLFTTEQSGHNPEHYRLVRTFGNFGVNPYVELEAIQLFREVPFSAIIAFDEEDIIRAARLREFLGIEGQDTKSAMAFRDKVLMKTYAIEGGVKCPGFQKIDSILDIYRFVEEYGLPVIIKPVDGMASMDVKVVRTEGELELLFKQGILPGYMIEEYIEANMYHVDGIFQDNQLVFVSSGAYSKNLLSYQQNTHDSFCYLLSPQDPIHSRLVQFVNKVLNSLPTPSVTAFHCEVFHTPDDQLLLCEIGSRPPGPGARLTKSIAMAYGIDLIKETTKLMCNCTHLDDSYEFKQFAAIYLLLKREGRLSSMMDSVPFEWVCEYFPRVKQGETFHKADSCIDIIASIVFTGSTMDELLNNYNELTAYVSANVQWNK